MLGLLNPLVVGSIIVFRHDNVMSCCNSNLLGEVFSGEVQSKHQQSVGLDSKSGFERDLHVGNHIRTYHREGKGMRRIFYTLQFLRWQINNSNKDKRQFR